MDDKDEDEEEQMVDMEIAVINQTNVVVSYFLTAHRFPK